MPHPDWYPHATPNLIDGLFLETSPIDPTYNCIAWAADDQDNWWWPSGSPDDYWPPGVPLQITLAAFVQAYGTLGYVPCADGALEIGFEKIAIYATGRPGQWVPQHAARQLPNGCWTSKLGSYEDIEHMTATCVECPIYGKVVVLMKRQTP